MRRQNYQQRKRYLTMLVSKVCIDPASLSYLTISTKTDYDRWSVDVTGASMIEASNGVTRLRRVFKVCID